MDILNKAKTGKKERPIKVVQFGEGNFLRGFVDYMIDIANEQGKFDGDIVLIKPIEFGNLDMFHKQDCQYTVSLRGNVNGEAKIINRIVTSVADAVDTYNEYDKYMGLAEIDTLRFVVSNTTEAGIVYDDTDKFELEPPKTFPGKLTKFLYHRFETFKGDMSKGLVMLPVELIDDNGIMLKKCVMQLIELWGLGDEFKKWVDEACVFTSTLVDRIITGYPRATEKEEWEKLGYEDHIMVTGEPFALWVIESAKDISKEFPLPDAGLPVIFTDNQKPYKQRKVRILNGAHTSFVLASYLCGNDIVRQSMHDDDIRNFMLKTIYDEVIPTLSLPEEELKQFAGATMADSGFIPEGFVGTQREIHEYQEYQGEFADPLEKSGIPCETFCLYSSLAGMMYPGGEEQETLYRSELADYEEQIQKAILKAKHVEAEPRGLMHYFDGNRQVAAKVISAFPRVQNIRGELFGVLECSICQPLTQSEIYELKNFWDGQMSDGWGEGFEQRPIYTREGELYVSFCADKRYWGIMTEEELDRVWNHGMTQTL